MSFSAILFDLDGTLLDTPKLWFKAYCSAFHTYGYTLSDTDFRSLYSTGKPLNYWLEKLNIDVSHITNLRSLRDAAYETLLRTDAVWKPGAQQCLLSIQKRYPTGIVTGSRKTYIAAIEEHIPLRNSVDVFLDEDDFGGKSKPEPDGLLLAAKMLGVDPTRCLYIGDQPCDADAARNAGMQCWIVIGEHTPKALPIQPDRTLHHIDEVVGLLDIR
jgi:HAD superfamily hydrolase (TIGR01509 family)